MVIGLLAVVLAPRACAWLGAIAALTAAGVGVYHAGVERRLWEGPSSCTGGGSGLSGLSGSDLPNPEAARVLVMCDEVSWSLFGTSMAGWNALLSAALVLLRLQAALSAPAPM